MKCLDFDRNVRRELSLYERFVAHAKHNIIVSREGLAPTVVKVDSRLITDPRRWSWSGTVVSYYTCRRTNFNFRESILGLF